ncbi:MAG: sigma factor, partial [Bacteroidales bacterium]
MTKRLQKHSFYNKKDAKEDKREILELQKDQECIPEKEKVEFDFNESVKSCYQRIYAYFLVSVKDKDTADDLTQETLLTAHHAWSIGKYQEEGRFLGWIMCIAHSRLMD